MGRREGYREEVVPLLDQFFGGKTVNPLIGYLEKNSNLPGPRGNLELADAFVDAVAGRRLDLTWKLSDRLREFTQEKAPTNDPKEFLSFCGTRLLGVIGASSPEETERALSVLRQSAQDPRWRVREGVAMSIQTLIDRDPGVMNELASWVADEAWLDMRAVAAGVAEPRLMKREGLPEQGLLLHKKIISRIVKGGDEREDEFRALRKTLGYSLSVVICGIPRAGFDYLRELSGSKDEDVLWIVRENLKKDRLKRGFPVEVSSIGTALAR